MYPHFHYPGFVGSGFPGIVATDPPEYTRAIEAWGVACRPNYDFLFANPDFPDYPFSEQCKVYDSMHVQEPFMPDVAGVPGSFGDSSSEFDGALAKHRPEPKGMGERIKKRGDRGAPFKKRASLSSDASPVRTRGRRTMCMTAGNVSQPPSRSKGQVIKIFDEVTPVPVVVQPRKGVVKPGSCEAGPSSAPKTIKPAVNSLVQTKEVSYIDEYLDESAKNRADAETAEEVRVRRSFQVGTTPSSLVKNVSTRTVKSRAKKRGGVTIVKDSTALKGYEAPLG